MVVSPPRTRRRRYIVENLVSMTGSSGDQSSESRSQSSCDKQGSSQEASSSKTSSKSNTLKSKPKSPSNSSQSMSYLTQISDNWFSHLDNKTEELDTKFNQWLELRKKNSVVEKNISQSVTTKLNAITEDIGIKSGDIDSRLNKAEAMKNQLMTNCQSLKQSLKQKKSEKSKVESKGRTVDKQMKELKTQMNEKESEKWMTNKKEANLLAQTMECRYQLTRSSNTLSLYFTDRKERIPVNAEDFHNHFWTYLNQKYNL